MRKLFRTVRPIYIFAGCMLLLALAFLLVHLAAFFMPAPDLHTVQTTIYLNEKGNVIGEEKGAESRYWVSLDDISPALIEATLLTEDKRFYEHHGLDYRRILAAITEDIKSLSLKEGASTLTQQYARNLFLTPEKKFSRKLKEAFYALRLEKHYSKDEILEGYLNTIYYGHGAYGIEAASKYYFNQSAAKLSLAEAAMLAGIPKGPAYYSPFNDAERAKKRQQYILKNLRKEGFITDAAYTAASEEKLTYATPNTAPEKRPYGYFLDAALKEAASILDMDMETIRSSGFQIYTTIKEETQHELMKQVHEVIPSESDVQAGAMVMQPKTGAITAMIGGRDYMTSPFNRAVAAKRMPGSAFKPFLYYAALENGYNARTMLESKPTVFQLPNDETYNPGNFNGYYANKPITLAQALALSDNIYAVKTHLFLGPETLVDTAKTFGFTGRLPAVPSLALGTAAVSVQEMVSGYSMLASGGIQTEPHTVVKIIDSNENTIYEREPAQKQLLDPKKAFILTDLMTGMFDHELDGYMAVTGSLISEQLTHTYAGKSGSTPTDSWMLGFSPRAVTGIWIGYDDNRKIEKVKETTYAKQIWANLMEGIHANQQIAPFIPPPGVIGIPIDPETGLRATPGCPSSRIMYFEAGQEPTEMCITHTNHMPAEQKGVLEKWFEVFFR